MSPASPVGQHVPPIDSQLIRNGWPAPSGESRAKAGRVVSLRKRLADRYNYGGGMCHRHGERPRTVLAMAEAAAGSQLSTMLEEKNRWLRELLWLAVRTRT